MFFRRAMYIPTSTLIDDLIDINTQKNVNEKTDAHDNDLKLDELDEEEFLGKVTCDNWAMSRA